MLTKGKMSELWSGGLRPVCPLPLRLFVQGSAHSAAEPVGKHLPSAAPLKRILPRCMGNRPATLIVSVVRSCMCVKTAVLPAPGQKPMHSTAPCTVLLETVHPLSNP